MRLSRSMKALFFAALLLLTPFSLSRPHTKTTPDVFWLDKYGNIAWEDEKARLDNFAIQLMHDPNEIGYFYVRSGRVSCSGEAQARAVRAKNYMIRVSTVPTLVEQNQLFAEMVQSTLIVVHGKGL